jgi:hypothetical protein
MVSSGVNSALFMFCLSKILLVGLHKYLRAWFSSGSGIDVAVCTWEKVRAYLSEVLKSKRIREA